MKAVVIAAAASGTGKTTVAAGLMGALRRRGLKVQPFKAGPDYIDPTYHTWATGQPSHNLDTWMLAPDSVCELYCRSMKGMDIAIIEGVMGLYDGHSPVSGEGSTAELAALLKAPVILVIDSRKRARSLAAIPAGLRDFDPSINIAGIIFNGIGSDHHYEICRLAIEHYTDIKVLGYLPRRDDLRFPERYLGLVPTVEGGTDNTLLTNLIAQCTDTLNLEEITTLAGTAAMPSFQPRLFPPSPLPQSVRIGIAGIGPSASIYHDSLDLLEAWGAEIVPFSPLQDRFLPLTSPALYRGRIPRELYAEGLSGNVPAYNAVRSAAETGMPVYAECGGRCTWATASVTRREKNTLWWGRSPFIPHRRSTPHLATAPCRPWPTDPSCAGAISFAATSFTGQLLQDNIDYTPPTSLLTGTGRKE
jgi:cobyrinic acid a,c-diamide synthase